MVPNNQTPEEQKTIKTSSPTNSVDYSFIFTQPDSTKTPKRSLKERFLALSKTKQLALVVSTCFVIVFIGLAVFAAFMMPSSTTRQTTIGTADINGDGVIDDKDTSATNNHDASEDSSADSSDSTDQTMTSSWWQKLLAINNTSSRSGNSTDSSDTNTTSSDNESATIDTGSSPDEEIDAAITDDSYTSDSDEVVSMNDQPSETGVDEPVDASPDPTPTTNNGTKLTVASWNILFSNSTSKVVEGIETILAKSQVVGLQEVGTNNTTANRRAIGSFASSTVGVYQPGGSTPILWNATMYTKKASGYRRISAYGFAKYATYVKLRNKATGQQFYVFNFHAVVGTRKPNEECSTNVCKTYKYEMNALAKFITAKKSENVPIFLTGDFNADYRFDYTCRLSWYPCRSFSSIGMNSGYSYTGGISSISKSDSTVGSASTVIDYVFSRKRSDVSPVAMQIMSPTASCNIDKSGQKHCWNGSDHKPVFFTVSLAK